MNVLMCVSVVILSSGEPVLRAVTYQSKKKNLEHVTDCQMNNRSKPSFGLMGRINVRPEEFFCQILRGAREPSDRVSI